MSEPNPSQARNILLRIAYDGTDFSGWQIQPGKPTIQGTLVEAFASIAAEPAQITGAGRTDAGVHAVAQAASVRLMSPIPCTNLVIALNDRLPESIRVLSATDVPFEFHARRDARSKIYRYRIYRAAICPPELVRYVHPFPYPLAEAAMGAAAQHFAGTRDFRSFASLDGASRAGDAESERSTVRTLLSSALGRQGHELLYTVEGTGFLNHMVRNIVGTLIEVGRGNIAPDAIPAILNACDRSAAGPTAPARGLHLIAVKYDLPSS
jgi:tRNA pseudouridine38-40 synthase